MSVLTTVGGGGAWVYLYFQSYSAYLKLYDTIIYNIPYMSISKNIPMKVWQMCYTFFVIGDQFLRL